MNFAVLAVRCSCGGQKIKQMVQCYLRGRNLRAGKKHHDEPCDAKIPFQGARTILPKDCRHVLVGFFATLQGLKKFRCFGYAVQDLAP